MSVRATNLQKWSTETINWSNRDLLRRAACALFRAMTGRVSIDECEHRSAVYESMSTAKLRRQVGFDLKRCQDSKLRVRDMPPIPVCPLNGYVDNMDF